MRIWTILDYCLPNDGVNTLQVVKTTEALARHNKDTTLFIPQKKETERSKESIYNYYGVDRPFAIEQLVSSVGKVGLLRMEKLLHPFHVFRSTTLRPDVVLTRHWPSAYASMQQGIPTYYETYKVFDGKLKVFLPFLKMMLRNPNFRAIVTHSERSADSITANPVLSKKIIAVHNGCNEKLLNEHMDQKEARHRIRIENKKTVLYTGHMGKDKGISILIQIAKRTPELQYLLVGYRNAKEQKRLQELIRQNETTNVALFPWVISGELEAYFFAADLTILPPMAKPFYNNGAGLPIKIFDYLASGKPIVGPNIDAVKPILCHGKNAWLVTPDDPESSAQSIRTLLNAPKQIEELANNAKSAAREFTWDTRALRLLDLFEKQN